MKNDRLSEEIVAVRSRMTVGWRGVNYDVRARLAKLRMFLGSAADQDEEALRHVPVSAIAALQTMAKGLVVDLAGLGEPYRTRASELLGNQKFLAKDVVEWFHGKSFTFAEVVAHSLTFNSMSDVHTTAESLLGVDLKAQLRTAISPYALRNKTEPAPPIVTDVDAVYREVDAAFKLRHILAHEAATGVELTVSTIGSMLTAITLFAEGIDAVLWATVYVDQPLTTYEMNIKAGETIDRARAEMEASFLRTVALSERSGDAQWVKDSQAKWVDYQEHWSKSSYGSLQGTMWPSVGGHDAAVTMKARTKQLRQWNGWQIGDQTEHPDHPKNRESDD